MFSRGVNEDVLKSEGHNVPKPTTETEQANGEKYKMKLWHNYVDPQHKNHERPVVDVSSPFNVLDETHQARRYGVQKVAFGFLSLNEFIGVHEEVPYTESHHTSEIFRLWMAGLNVWHMNYFIARAQVSGNATGNPRTKFAWTIAMLMGTIRVNIAGMIGVGGYFYSYEYLYTHGPKPFRIRDPTPNGWKRAWDDGQECYLPRAAASVFPAIGYAFFMGRWKKAGFWFMTTLMAGLYYEYARRNILFGSRLFYSYLANQDSQRQAAWGSLAPNLKHRVDPDTNRNESVAQFKYFRITSGTMQDTVWNNCTHETQPLARGGIKIPNPYFNWLKAPQHYNAKPWKVKNDMWEMPQVMNAQMRSGAMD
ncbi:hypothetical protein GH5_03614 [Leishmania sp. Ghana 2012 LV757]|uniref:hypothetical protein n=1 Tax=Leishmania sp. Ghana 2012 LV757 TaxID=2803181 RepID=UPI001B3EB607|nr:hypothetical protein GH5_03614 [Leishmania sp. Ghana 2012 LV757]